MNEALEMILALPSDASLFILLMGGSKIVHQVGFMEIYSVGEQLNRKLQSFLTSNIKYSVEGSAFCSTTLYS